MRGDTGSAAAVAAALELCDMLGIIQDRDVEKGNCTSSFTMLVCHACPHTLMLCAHTYASTVGTRRM